MKITRRLIVFLLFLALQWSGARAQSPAAHDSSLTVTDQIVRLSLVQGDVRVARGKAGEHATGSDWGQAQANLPLLTGFSLVTGSGRAVIELEDASTVYLGENSVLTFDLLADQGKVPHTVLSLVSGVATLRIAPTVKSETFVLITPASHLALHDGASTFLRVNSYLDATRYTILESSRLRINSESDDQQAADQTLTYYADGHIAKAPALRNDPLAAWDAWTKEQVKQRETEMAAAMRDSGLSTPLPGLNDLEQSGHFFSCAPHGTCWAPNEPASAQPARLLSRPQWSARPHLVLAAQYRTVQYFGSSPSGYSPYGSNGLLYPINAFPCMPGGIAGIAWAPGQTFVPYSALYANSYDWALCHEGSWIERNRGYVWVAGEHKHHHCPVRWVKYDGKPGFVPLNPRDERGKPPLNLDHGVFLLDNKTDAEYVRSTAGARVKLMDDPPRQFRSIYYPPLHSVGAPQPIAHALEAHLSRLSSGGRRIELASSEPVRIGRHAQEFSVVHEEFSSGHSRTVTGHFGGSAGVARAASPGFSGIRGGFSGERGSSFSGSGSIARAAGGSGGGGAESHGGGMTGGAAHGGGGSAGGGSAGGGGHH